MTRALAAPPPRGRYETLQTTAGVSVAAVQRAAALRLARWRARAFTPSTAHLLIAALADLPDDVEDLIALVEAAPDNAFEGGRAQLSVRLPTVTADSVRRVPIQLRAGGVQGVLAWHVLTAALDRQLDAEGAPPYPPEPSP